MTKPTVFDRGERQDLRQTRQTKHAPQSLAATRHFVTNFSAGKADFITLDVIKRNAVDGGRKRDQIHVTWWREGASLCVRRFTSA